VSLAALPGWAIIGVLLVLTVALFLPWAVPFDRIMHLIVTWRGTTPASETQSPDDHDLVGGDRSSTMSVTDRREGICHGDPEGGTEEVSPER
jgi:hypothetical protein